MSKWNIDQSASQDKSTGNDTMSAESDPRLDVHPTGVSAEHPQTAPSHSDSVSTAHDGSTAAYEHPNGPHGTERRRRDGGHSRRQHAMAEEPMSTPNHGAESDLLDILSGRRWLILGIIAGSLVAGGIILSLLTPQYTATAQLLIESRGPTLPTLETILPGLGADKESIVSETAVLRSRTLLANVVERLNLDSDPEFNSSLVPSKLIAHIKRVAPGLVTRLERIAGLDAKPDENIDAIRARIVDALSARLEIAIIPDSRVISVRFTSEYPQKAAQIANTLVAEYLAAQQNARIQASDRTNAWIKQKIDDLQAQLLESEEQVENFRSDAGLLETAGTTLTSQQMADLNAQLTQARAATSAATARLSQINELTAEPDGGGIYASSEVLQSRLIQNLREQQMLIERRITELSSEYVSTHPTMVQLRADAEGLRNQISIEVDRISQGLRNEVSIARERQAALERQVARLTSRLSETNENEIQLRSLEREADANRELLETLLARQKELEVPDEMHAYQSDARVISDADQPIAPSFPNKPLSMGAIFLASTLFAVIIAFLVDIRRRGFTDMEQLEAVSKLTAIGFIPLIKSRRQKSQFLDTMLTDPGLPFAQAIKAIDWQFGDLAPVPCKSILVTSSTTEEGKTSTAIALARVRASRGEKVLLIDADIRKPSVREYLKLSKTAGLREALENGRLGEDLIRPDIHSSLDILQAGEASADALTWIASPRMQSILEILSSKYEYIIIDSPPITAAPDAIALSKIVDTTILTVRWVKTPAHVLAYSLRLLRRNGGHISGTILTMLDASKTSNYSYGYYGAYGEYGR